MAEPSHRVALVDAEGRPLRAPVDVPLPWPSARDLRDAVAAPDAVEVVPPWQADGVVTHLLSTSARDGAGSPWPVASDALGRRAAGGDGWPAWYLPGWRHQVDAWVSAVLAERGLTPTGPAEIVRWWSLSAVLRFPVSASDGAARDVWFKATCEGFHDEAAITAALAGVADAPIPAVLGVDTGRAWLVLADVPGAGEDASLDVALAAATAMARLQIRLIPQARTLPIPVRDADATIAALRAVVHGSVETPVMPPELVSGARLAEPRLAAMVRALDGVGIPSTLVHGDLHTGNVAGTPAHPLIFDWTDACLAHPYLDGRLLANSVVARREPGADPAALERAVRDAFTGPWRAAYPDLDHDLAWELSRDAEHVFEMISYEGIVRAQAPGSRWELGGVITEKLARLVDRGGSEAAAVVAPPA